MTARMVRRVESGNGISVGQAPPTPSVVLAEIRIRAERDNLTPWHFPALLRLGVLGLIQISKFREPEPEGGDRHVALRTQCAVHRSAARRNAAQVFSIEAEAGAGAGEQGKDRKTD
jgi:hypothetical protein